MTAKTEALWWSSDLSLRSRDDIPAPLAARFDTPHEVMGPDVGAVSRAEMTNCETLFALRAKNFEPSFENDRAVMKLEAARCQALRLLAKAPATSRAAGPPLSLDRGALPVLPPLLGPQPSRTELLEREEAARRGTPWSEFDRDARIVPASPDRAIVKGPDWQTQIDVLARGDFTGDGLTDVLLRTLSSLTEGSYREVRLRVLSRVGGHGLWSVASEPPL